MLSSLTENHLADLTAEQRLACINDKAEGPVALTVSMQKTACVLLHMVAKSKLSKIQPIFLDTGAHFAETLEMIDQYERLLGLSIIRIQPSGENLAVLEKKFSELFPVLHQEGVHACCDARKVQPLLRVLQDDYKGRIAGLMRSEGSQRETAKFMDFDGRLSPPHPVFHPIVDWNAQRVDDYIEENALPIHPLYRWSYGSIGCTHCTTPLLPGEKDRDGRWRQLRTSEGAGKEYCLVNPVDRKKGQSS